MLVHAFEIGESMILRMEDGTDVEVKLIAGRPTYCKIGIMAPQSVRVLRGELHEKEKYATKSQ